jgi:hypothetical protein
LDWKRAVTTALLAGAVAAGSLRAGEVLDNAKVLKMVKDGVSLKVILRLMDPAPVPGEKAKASNCRFDSSAEAISEIQKAGKEGAWQPQDISALQEKIIELANKDQRFLSDLVTRALNVFDNADPNEYEAMMRELVEQGRRVVPHLLDKRNMESDRMRGGVVDAIGRIAEKSDDVVKAMALMLTDRSKPVRLQAAKCIVALASPATPEELIGRLNSRTEKLDGAAMALAYLGDQRAVEPLTKLLKLGNDVDARVCAAFALGELRAKSAPALEALLEAVLDEREENLRDSAAAALAKIGDKRTPRYVIKACERYRQGRDVLMRSLAYFKDIEALEFLVRQVESDEPKTKKAAVETLRLMTGENAADADEWRGVLEVIRVRPDWRAADGRGVPEAGREGGDKGIPTSTR